MTHIKNLSSLDFLNIADTRVSDDGLEPLKTLPVLGSLNARNTPVTDLGLEHLQGLKSLKLLFLTGAQTTSEGRAKLRKALPNCKVEPDN